MNKSLLIKTLNKEPTTKVPIWMMRQAGRHLPEYLNLRKKAGSFLNLCFNPKYAAKVTLQPIDRYDMDAAILFSDILVIPYALGQDLKFVENKGPILNKIESISQLKISKFDEKLSPIYETIDIIKSSISKEKELVGFAGAPWTVLTYMISGGKSNFKNLLSWIKLNQIEFEKLLNFVEKQTIVYLNNQIKAGVNVIQIFDSWAGFLKDEKLKKYSLNPIKRICESIKKNNKNVKIIIFPKGVGKESICFANSVNCDAISIETELDILWARDNLQKNKVVQGNLSNEILLNGENLEKEVMKILENFKNGHHIFNLGHGVLKETPIKNVEKVVRIVKDFRK